MDTVLEKIVNHLKGDRVSRIAVCGMGGVGKTTLLKHIHNQFVREEEKFDKVIWVTVSSKLDVPQIQNAISKQMDGKPLKEEDSSTRARMTLALLQRGNNLLILDDMWEAFSDEDVGIPAESRGLNLVLSTRSREVAQQMDCDIFMLEPLSHQNALHLFLHIVRDVVLSDDGNIKPGLEATLMQILKECCGLPLAIVTVANTMKGMSDDQNSWAKALNQLQNGRRAEEGGPIFGLLKFCYDRLEDKKVQQCFLYCALFSEYFEIPKSRLIEYWIEEGFIDQMDTRHEMTCEGHEILRKLQDRCLLECVIEDDGFMPNKKYGVKQHESVKMHDLLREMALNITSTSPRFFVSEEELRNQKAWPRDVEKVSLMFNNFRMEEIPWATAHVKYNMLTTLLMPDNEVVATPESFFEQMPALRILDLSWNDELSSLPSSISGLENLTTLLLECCYSLEKVPSLSKCLALTKLNLKETAIEEVPDGMETLANLKYLNLQGTQIEELPERILWKLSNLQYLLVSDTEIRIESVVTLRKLEYVEAKLVQR